MNDVPFIHKYMINENFCEAFERGTQTNQYFSDLLVV